LSVWGENIDQLQIGQTYRFSCVNVHTFRREKNLSLSRQSTNEVTSNSAIAPAIEEDEIVLENAKFIGCKNFMIHVSCVYCTGKLLLDCGNGAATTARSKCNLLQLVKDHNMKLQQ
jgi:hypothetical protein